jgi:hypothetical protein
MWRAVTTVVLIGLLVAGGFAIHRLGWSQGYAAAELTAAGEEAPAPPLAPPGWRPIGFAYRPLGGGLLVALLLGLIFLAVSGKLVRVIMWGAMGGPAMAGSWMADPWGHHRHRMHGPVPPWHGSRCEQPGERPREGDERTGADA